MSYIETLNIAPFESVDFPPTWSHPWQQWPLSFQTPPWKFPVQLRHMCFLGCVCLGQNIRAIGWSFGCGSVHPNPFCSHQSHIYIYIMF